MVDHQGDCTQSKRKEIHKNRDKVDSFFYLRAGDVDAAGEGDGRHGHHVRVGDQVPRPSNPATRRPGGAEIKHSNPAAL